MENVPWAELSIWTGQVWISLVLLFILFSWLGGKPALLGVPQPQAEIRVLSVGLSGIENLAAVVLAVGPKVSSSFCA